MAKRMTVGRSHRTTVKHKLMNDLIGEEVGVVGNLHRVDRHVWLDLNAGDAVAEEGQSWRESCSPGIFAYHASRARKPVTVRLHEVDAAVYGSLLSRLAVQLPDLGYVRDGVTCWRIGSRVELRALHMDGRRAQADDVHRRDAVLVVHDPNSITDWAMRGTFAREIAARTEWFRSLSTLGCNVCGIKRAPLEKPGTLPFEDDPDLMSPAERKNWFRLIGTQQQDVPEKRDLLLAAIENDSSQWAYLIQTAVAGQWRQKTETRVRVAFARAGLTVDMAWLRQNPDHFERIKQNLFLTRRELREAANTPLPFGDLNVKAV